MPFITDLISKITNFRVKIGDKLNTLKSQIGQLNLLTTNDKTSLVGAVNEVNNIKIGGRNIILTSQKYNSDSSIWYTPNGSIIIPSTNGMIVGNSVLITPQFSVEFIDGEQYVISFDYMSSTPSKIIYNGSFRDITEGNSEKIRVSFPFVFNKNENKTTIYFQNPIQGTSCAISNIKLEKGNKATDWTPAIEDQVSNWAETDSNSLSFIKGKEIVNNEFNNVYDQISSRANNRLSNLASDLTADEKRVIQDKTGAVSKTGDNVTPNSKWDNYSKGIYGALDTDSWRIQGNLVSPNNIELELATADDATEAIVVRQYSGEFASRVREVYLLDANGNTSFPEFVRSPKGFVTEYYDEFTIGQRYAQNIKFTEEQTLLNGFVKFSGEVVVDNGLRVGSLVSLGRVTAPSFYESSLRKYKKNIKEYSNNALDIVKSLDVVTYDRTDSDISNKIGIIADDSHEDVLNEEKTAVDLYKTIFVLAKAVQELSEKVEKIRKQNNVDITDSKFFYEL